MPKISNKTKLEAVKKWLQENNIEYVEKHESKFGVTIDLKIPSLMIAVFVSNDDKEWEEYIYNKESDKIRTSRFAFKLHWIYKPFFIRESETKAFVLEKIQDCCINRMLYKQKKWQKENSK